MEIVFFALLGIVLGAEMQKETKEAKVMVNLKINQGYLAGFKEMSLNGREFFSFLGIPFAKPPTGKLRFKNPRPAERWEGTLQADKPPKRCTQFDMAKSIMNIFTVTGDEDCLYLNVHSPKRNDPRERLPVMVWIHGGGFNYGSASDYPPYVLLNENIVLVVIQYRLSIFGFLSTGNSTIGGNYGLKDQVMALKWIQENILNFGGDPGRVTIFGESAGGASVHLLMLSPSAKGLFHNAISQSGVSNCPWSVTRVERETARKLGDLVGCPLDDEDELYLECLLQKDGKELVEKSQHLYEWGNSPMTWVPRVDEEFLPDEPLVLLKEGKYHHVNFISGINRDEGATIGFYKHQPGLLDQLVTDFDKNGPVVMILEKEENSTELVHKLFRHYLEGKTLSKESFLSLENMYTDRMFSVCHEVATKFHSENPEMTTYRYQLDWRGQISILSLFNITDFKDAVAHGDDIFYLFFGSGFLIIPMQRPEDLKLREIFVKLWANFAATGNPTPDNSTLGFLWTPATPSQFQQLSLKPEPSMSEYVNTRAMDFFGSLPLRENFLLHGRESFSCSGQELEDTINYN